MNKLLKKRNILVILSIFQFFVLSSLFSGEILFEVKDNAGQPIMSVQDDGIWILNSVGDTLMTVNNDSIRFGIDAAMQRSFAIQQSGSRKVKERVDEENLFEVSNSDIVDSYEGPMMLWYPQREAFRVGNVLINEPSEVGYNSFGSGYHAQALGSYSTSLGNGSQSSGVGSVAIGWGSLASGDQSIAVGRFAEATALGSVAIGHDTEASNEYSVAIGLNTTASGMWSTAIGKNTSATGYNTTALGAETVSSGYYSTATGQYTTAQSYNTFVVGRYNELLGSIFSWVDTDPLFVVGNGSSSSLTNDAFTVLKNGTTNTDGEINRTSTGSANMVPIAYGFISSSGSIQTGTGNFICTWNDTSNRYEITISDESYFYSDYITNVTPTSTAIARVSSGGGKMYVYFTNLSGSNIQSHFQFTTYKP